MAPAQAWLNRTSSSIGNVRAKWVDSSSNVAGRCSRAAPIELP